MQLAVGEHHACGIATDGLAYCWGWNGNASLGTGDFTDRYVPAPVVNSGELAFRSITAGEDHTCALTVEGKAYCWGRNVYGVLGIGTTEEYATVPTPVAGGHTFKQVHTSAQVVTCGLTAEGKAYCWGAVSGVTSAPELCDSSGCYVPVPVAEGLVFEELFASYYGYGCGRTGNGEVHCWRSGAGVERVAAPVPFAALAPTVLDASYGCALGQAGTAYCWSVAPVPSGQAPPALNAAPLVGGPQLKRVISGARFGRVCGIGVDDLAYCWRDGPDSPGPVLIPRIASEQEP